MEWFQAKRYLENNVHVNDDLNSPNSSYRYLFAKNGNLFKVKVGINSHINITYEMLKTCFGYLTTTNGFYRSEFKKDFHREDKNKPCYFHTIGQIFCKAGIAYMKNDGHGYCLKKEDV